LRAGCLAKTSRTLASDALTTHLRTIATRRDRAPAVRLAGGCSGHGETAGSAINWMWPLDA
jgi:hypothetical protein